MDQSEKVTGELRLSTRVAMRAARVRTDALLACLDVVLLGAAYTMVLLLRFDGAVPGHHWSDFLRWLPLAVAVALLMNRVFGLYGQIWRHASMQEAQRLLGAGCTVVAVLLAVEAAGGRNVPFSVVLLGTGAGTFFMAAVRFQSRLFSFRRRRDDANGLRVVVIGAADAGAALVRDMLKSPRAGLVPVAVLDDDPRRLGRSLMGLRIEGTIEDLPAVAARARAHQAVLAVSSPTHEIVRRAAAAAEQAEVALKIVPGIASHIRGEVSVRDVRDVEIGDLIGRKEVVTDLDAVAAMLRGRRVLITGAGGSIGSEIARQVAQCEPASLVVLDHDESHLHDLVTSMTEPVVQALADIRHRTRVRQVFLQHRPEVVFHAAAHKHVPLLESHPCEAVATNVLGTDNLLAACEEVGVERFVFISTDKAVQPTSVMGASKRLGEQLVLARRPDGARYCAVRFGNVLGSRGSVIPTFVRQIAAGGPVTVTDPRMTRYFMSIEEAVQLVLQASALSDGGEVFVLDMGEPVRILELAERMIRLSGRRVGTDIAIEITGSRPGEKLNEALYLPDETEHATVHPSIVYVRPAVLPVPVLDAGVLELDRLTAELGAPAVREALFDLVNMAVAGAVEPENPVEPALESQS
jgi:FlaA1/EpsC-like NDP-sugar epimerase